MGIEKEILERWGKEGCRILTMRLCDQNKKERAVALALLDFDGAKTFVLDGLPDKCFKTKE